MKTSLRTVPVACAAAVATGALVAGCAGMSMQAKFTQDSLPDAVKVPAGYSVAMETVGSGEITYECRAKAAMAGDHEWAFVGPQAVLKDRMGMAVGKYHGPPATWEAMDGSKITGTQLAVAPAGAGNIPLQLVKANPAVSGKDGMGAMMGISHIQRVATRGGAAPALACAAANVGQRQIVSYQADYIFWKAM